MTGMDQYMEAEMNRYYRTVAQRIGTGIAQGRLPHLKQAIDADDTVQACIALRASATPLAEQDAAFDLLLALVGWIPGPGEGSKQILRVVNRETQRFVRHFFDVLRHTLAQSRIKTSPEALLAGLFDMHSLAEELPQIARAIEASVAFRVLPPETRASVRAVLANVREQLPHMNEAAWARMNTWIRAQRNNASMDSGLQGPAVTEKPTPESAGVKQTVRRPKEGTEPTWLELNFHYSNLEPVAHAPYRVIFADGSTIDGSLDAQGFARLENIPEGEAMIYYGEDPRPFVRPSIVTVDGCEDQLAAELREVDLEPDDLPDVAQYVTGRKT